MRLQIYCKQLYQKRLQHRWFLVNIVKFLRKSFLWNPFGWQVLLTWSLILFTALPQTFSLSKGCHLYFLQHTYFLQVTFSSLMFFLPWYWCIIILNFPKNVILYFHISIPLDIGHKRNVHKAYLRLIYAIFPGVCEGASKVALLKKYY